MARTNYSFVGKGSAYLRNRDKAEGLMRVGNVSALEFAVETNKISQPDYENSGGGEANSIDRITAVNANMTALELSGRTLAIALRGTASDVAGGSTVTAERHTAYKGALIAFDELPDISDPGATITVTQDPAGTPTVMTLDTDYTVTRAGVIPTTTGAIVDGDTVDVAYTKAPQVIVEALTESAQEFELLFNGLNEAASGRAVMVRIYRIKFSPTSGLGVIGDEFAELPMEGTCLADPAIVATGLSKYFRVIQED